MLTTTLSSITRNRPPRPDDYSDRARRIKILMEKYSPDDKIPMGSLVNEFGVRGALDLVRDDLPMTKESLLKFSFLIAKTAIPFVHHVHRRAIACFEVAEDFINGHSNLDSFDRAVKSIQRIYQPGHLGMRAIGVLQAPMVMHHDPVEAARCTITMLNRLRDQHNEIHRKLTGESLDFSEFSAQVIEAFLSLDPRVSDDSDETQKFALSSKRVKQLG